MTALARLGSFGFTYATILILSFIVDEEYKNFQGFTFLVTTFVLSVWIYICHQIDKTSPKELKEMLYVMTFLCGFTSLGSFLGYC